MLVDPLVLGLTLLAAAGLGFLLALVIARRAPRARRSAKADAGGSERGETGGRQGGDVSGPYAPPESSVQAQFDARLRAMRDDAEDQARRTLLAAMERTAAAVTFETTQVTVTLASDDLKGRIIGREGRNLRSFEQVAGVELLLEDDSPNVTISCLDPVRREIARRTLEALLGDGKIQPSRIEEVHARLRASFEEELPEVGQAAARRARVGALSPAVAKALGALRYRTSASQNVLEHSIECADLAARIASEIRADEAIARRAALLHDLGKGLSDEWPGSHAVAGAAFLRAADEAEAVCHAVEAHHDDVEPRTAEAAVVRIADAVSGSRPGARKPDAEAFLKRVASLEQVARSEPGVLDAYAIRAGRELRVVVRSDAVAEEEAQSLAGRLAARLGDQPEFRGPVDVVVVRETRHRATAEREVP